MNASATPELMGLDAMARSFSSLAPAVWELGLSEHLACEAEGLSLPRFEGLPLFRLKMAVRAARGAVIESLAVEPGDGLEILVAAIVANDVEARFPIVWHDGWPFVSLRSDTATIAGGAGETIPCPKGDGEDA